MGGGEMTIYSNLRHSASFLDWPIGGKNRGQCTFKVETGKRGQRVVRQTTNKHGTWCKPKSGTYADKVWIADGDDGRTYIIRWSMGFFSVSRSDFMSHETAHDETTPERFAELKALTDAAINS